MLQIVQLVMEEMMMHHSIGTQSCFMVSNCSFSNEFLCFEVYDHSKPHLITMIILALKS